MIQVGVAYATQQEQVWRDIRVPTGVTVKDVIEASGILNEFSEIDLKRNKVGVLGRITELDQTVNEGDRVEIYRPIAVVPESLKRKKYKLRKLAPTIEKDDAVIRIIDE